MGKCTLAVLFAKLCGASRAQVLGSPVGEALLVPQRILVKQRRTHG